MRTLDLYKNPSNIHGKNSTVFEQFPIIQIGSQSFSAMRGGEEPYNSNSYKLLDMFDEQKFEARKPAPSFWTSEIHLYDVRNM